MSCAVWRASLKHWTPHSRSWTFWNQPAVLSLGRQQPSPVEMLVGCKLVIGLPERIDSIICINTLETETVDLIDTFVTIDTLDN